MNGKMEQWNEILELLTNAIILNCLYYIHGNFEWKHFQKSAQLSHILNTIFLNMKQEYIPSYHYYSELQFWKGPRVVEIFINIASHFKIPTYTVCRYFISDWASHFKIPTYTVCRYFISDWVWENLSCFKGVHHETKQHMRFQTFGIFVRDSR